MNLNKTILTISISTLISLYGLYLILQLTNYGFDLTDEDFILIQLNTSIAININ